MKPISLNQSFEIVNLLTTQERYLIVSSDIFCDITGKPKYWCNYCDKHSEFSAIQNFILDLSYHFAGIVKLNTNSQFNLYLSDAYEACVYTICQIIRTVRNFTNE